MAVQIAAGGFVSQHSTAGSDREILSAKMMTVNDTNSSHRPTNVCKLSRRILIDTRSVKLVFASINNFFGFLCLSLSLSLSLSHLKENVFFYSFDNLVNTEKRKIAWVSGTKTQETKKV